jgi:hypothetical protein
MNRLLRAFSAAALLGCGESEPQSQPLEPLPNPGILIAQSGELATTDRGGTATFTVVLKSAPSADVTLAVRSSNPSVGTPSPAALVFSAANYSTPQTITVTGIPDHVALGHIAYQIVLDPAQSQDSAYAGLRTNPLSVVHRDSDRAGITATPSASETSDTGGTISVSVVLDSQPLAPVTVNLTVAPPSYAALSGSVLSFTTEDWNKPQSVTLTGKYSPLIEGTKEYFLSVGVTADSDAQYARLSAAQIRLTHRDFVPRSCKQIKTVAPAAPDGPYQVDPDGPGGPMLPISVYCDMTRDDGGWTLVARMADGSTGVHRTPDAVGTVSEPAQNTTAKLSDELINLLREDLAASILRIEAADGKIDYFREAKPFAALGYTGSINLVYDTYAAAMAQNGGCRGAYNGTYHTGLVGWTCYDSFLYADNPGFRAVNYQAGVLWVK